MKHLCYNKIKSVENITLDENGKLVRDEKEIANIFNDFFVNILPNSEINPKMISLILETFLIMRLKMLFINMGIILVSLHLKII